MKNKNTNQNHNGSASQVDEILKAPVFKKARNKAKQYAENPKTMLNVLGDVVNKAVNLEDKNSTNNFAQNVAVLVRLVKAVIQKQYDKLPYKSLIRVVAGLLYFLFVADIVPDIIPLVGLLDDATVLAWVISSLKTDITDFRNWELQKEKRNMNRNLNAA